MLYADLELARRLERVEMEGGRAYAEARLRLDPGAACAFLTAGGASAVFDTTDSPMTQTFGLGLFGEVTGEALGELERFFTERKAPVHHEVSPLAGVELFSRLCARGYRPVELTSVLYQPVGEVETADRRAIQVRRMEPGEEEQWSETALRGWIGEHPEYREFLRESGRLMAHSLGMRAYFAELAGEVIATGVLRIHAGVALFGGASTVPEARGRGAQQALLAARMKDARREGCDLAMMCAAPGSASQRNAERLGFRIAYTRVKWALGGA